MPIRLIVLIALLSLVAACESDTDPQRGTRKIPVTPIEGVAQRHGDSHCRAVAGQRADDARANGYGFEVENSVFAEAYQDCFASHAENRRQLEAR